MTEKEILYYALIGGIPLLAFLIIILLSRRAEPKSL